MPSSEDPADWAPVTMTWRLWSKIEDVENPGQVELIFDEPPAPDDAPATDPKADGDVIVMQVEDEKDEPGMWFFASPEVAARYTVGKTYLVTIDPTPLEAR